MAQITRLAILLIVVAVIVLAAHWPALSAQALWVDDDEYIRDNVLVHHPSWNSVYRFFTELLEPSTHSGYPEPVAVTSLMVDYHFGGRPENPRQFHRTSLCLHVMNTVLVIVLLQLLFGQPWVAALVGLLFGTHPLTVEPIVWLAQRKTLLAAVFVSASLVLYVLHTRRGGWKRYTACLVLFALALASKPTSVPFPLLLILLDYWPLGRLNRRTILEKVPFFVLASIAAVITLLTDWDLLSDAPCAPLGIPPWHAVLIVCHEIGFYLGKILWPTHLSACYPPPEPLALSNPTVLAGGVTTVVLIGAIVASLNWTRALATGFGIWLVALFPAMGVIQHGSFYTFDN